jgi:hypothetical protein
MDNVEYYKLDVETISPVYMNVMKLAEVIEMVKSGVKRARDPCAAELPKGNYFAGCPVQTSGIKDRVASEPGMRLAIANTEATCVKTAAGSPPAPRCLFAYSL